jgi:hypothetical protein
MPETSMRKLWFEYVNKTRRRLQRKDKSATHRQAMKEASITWPKEKARLQNRIKREARKLEKERIAAKGAAEEKSSGK